LFSTMFLIVSARISFFFSMYEGVLKKGIV
jgi:hypothetical protein